MSEKERTMSGTTGSHMFLHKTGILKDKELLVLCKLTSPGIRERPEIQIFTDGSEEPNSIVKVKSFAVVQKGDLVPKIVKAKYDNYICITGSGTGSKPTYLRTDTREQRDEWCSQLQALMSIKNTPNQKPSQPPQPPQPPHHYRERTQTDASSHKPPVSRTRRGAPTTAPGSMLGIFQDELVKAVKQRINPPEHVEETEESQVCCGRHHLETVASHDALCQDTYENVHHVHNKEDWRRQQQTSTQALKKKQELYQDFHLTKMLQEQADQNENVYEIPELRRDPSPGSDNRLSGCSTSSEESEGGAPKSLHSCKEPTESSWPPSPTPSDESDLESSEGNPLSSKTFTGELPGRTFSNLKEPEASMCLNEQIYENTTRTDSRNTTPPRSAFVRNDANPHVPLRTSSMPLVTAKPVPPKPPKKPKKTQATKIETQCKKLKDERLSGTATVRVAKTILARNLFQLSLNETRDRILVMDVPCELKDHFRVGDQWLKVNDTMLKSVRFAQECVQYSDKPEIEITLRRIPCGAICDFPWNSKDVDDIGLDLRGNEIEQVYPDGLAHRRGSLQSNDTACLNMNSAGLRCNNVITEVNFDCVHPYASTEQVWEMIKKAGRFVVLILHPVDFRTVQRDKDELYVNVRHSRSMCNGT